MRATLNGETREISSGTNLKKLLEEMRVDVKYVAVAVNMEFIPRSEYEKILIGEGDDVEIVSPQAGG
jgi:sulfur carrier protein